MKVFISWSGERSRAVAEALRDWTQSVIQAVEPWMSAEDIAKGARWSFILANSLQDTHFGILCLTPENLTAPWLIFEAGALSKALENAYVCPFLLNLKSTDIQGPLAQFQATEAAKKDDVRKMMQSMNAALAKSPGNQPLPDEKLTVSFEKWWPDLENRLQSIPPTQSPMPESRRPEDKIDEILELVRGMARSEKTDFGPDILPPPPLISGTHQYTSAAGTDFTPPPVQMTESPPRGEKR